MKRRVATFEQKQMNDWCHVCGERTQPHVEVWYPKNAEHEQKQTQYMRICAYCVEVMSELTRHRQGSEPSAVS
jgi:hypothetical protein